MTTPDTLPAGKTVFSGSIWFQERYFLVALQEEMERAREHGTPLSILLVRVPEATRRAAHIFFLLAEAEQGNSFFGLLANGDYVVCMPGSGYAECASQRVALSHALADFRVRSGLAVLDDEETAAQLIAVALRDCDETGRRHFDNLDLRVACQSAFARLHDR